MNIAIIGAGNVGRALATSAMRVGHSVTVSSAKRRHGGDAGARRPGAKAAESNRAAVEGADLVVLAVPYMTHRRRPRRHRPGARRQDRRGRHQPAEAGLLRPGDRGDLRRRGDPGPRPVGARREGLQHGPRGQADRSQGRRPGRSTDS